MTTCPNGHESVDPDWCDTCGTRLSAADPTPAATPSPSGAGGAAPPAGSPTATAACPNCSVANSIDSLFCEDCGYDFTTGQAPAPPAPRPPVIESATPLAGAAQSATPGSAVPPKPPPAPPTTEWTLQVSVDPAWFALKGSLADAPCPPVSSIEIGLPTSSALVGRTSQSRNLHPEIALDNDPGVSRRHAQLVFDVGAWTIADVGSTNGTYLVASGTEPTEHTEALLANTAATIAPGDRIFLGAFTCLSLVHHPDRAGTPTNGA